MQPHAKHHTWCMHCCPVPIPVKAVQKVQLCICTLQSCCTISPAIFSCSHTYLHHYYATDLTMLAVISPGLLSDYRPNRCRPLPSPPSAILCQGSPCGSILTGKWLPSSLVLLVLHGVPRSVYSHTIPAYSSTLVLCLVIAPCCCLCQRLQRSATVQLHQSYSCVWVLSCMQTAAVC